MKKGRVSKFLMREKRKIEFMRTLIKIVFNQMQRVKE